MSFPTSTAPRTSTALRALQVTAVLQLLNVGWQYVTAGQLFPQGGPEQLHSGGAIVLHLLGALATVAAVVLWRRENGSPGVAVLALVVLVAGIVQAATGGRDTLAVHVPGAMVLTAGAVWLVVWAYTKATRPAVPR